MMTKKIVMGWPIALMALFGLMATACGGEDPTPTSVPPTPTSAPAAAAAVAPTATPVPTALDQLVAAADEEGGVIRAMGGVWNNPKRQSAMEISMEKMYGIDINYEYTPLAGGVSQNAQAAQLLEEQNPGLALVDEKPQRFLGFADILVGAWGAWT